MAAQAVDGGDGRTAKPWFKRPLGILGIVIGVIVLLVAIGGSGSEEPADPAAAPDADTADDQPDDTAEEPEPGPEPEPEPEQEPEPEPDPEPESRFEPVTIEGTGDDIVDLPAADGSVLVAAFTHDGDRNFAVESYGNGDRLDLLVNHIGPYSGTVPLNFGQAQPDELDISADGSWSVTISDVLDQPILDDPVEGTGDQVLLIATTAGRLDISHHGERNFAVLSYGNRRDLLVNEIGSYDGTVRLGGDALVLEIAADGDWTVTPQ